MINKISEELSKKLSSRTGSTPEEKEIYAYSIEVLLSLIINLIILAFTAYTFKKIPELVIFIIFFSGLRTFAGGYHAKTHIECMTISFIIFSISALASTYLKSIGAITMIIGIISSILLIFKYAPAESKNKPLNGTERKKFKLISRGIVFLFSICIIVLYFYKAETNYIYLTAVIAMTIESISLINFA